MRTRTGTSRARLALCALAAAAGLAATVPEARGQTLPGPVWHELMQEGHEKLAERLSEALELRAAPDARKVEELLARWESETGGPDSGWDWLAVTRLWLRAGEAARAELSLANAEGRVPGGLLLLDQARVAFLAGQPDIGEQAYWKGCELADDAAAVEYWLDIEGLATPRELERWSAFRTLPGTQRDLCRFLHDFWNERALASALPVAARLHQHYDRLRYALENYRRRGGKKGPTLSNQLGRPRNAVYDDRGLVYLRMGEPDRITSFAGNPAIGQDLVSAECFQPNESWAYDFPDGTRVFHFTTFGGTDDWWLVENLGQVYRCGTPDRSGSAFAQGQLTPINQYQGSVPLGLSAGLVLQDLYRSRQGLDPRYAEIAQRMRNESPSSPSAGALSSSVTAGLEAQRQLQREREWTRADAEFAIASVPDRPDVDAESRLLIEELQFRSSLPERNRVWLNGLVEARELQPEPLPGGLYRYRVEARWAVLGEEDGGYDRFTSNVEAVVDHRLGQDESLPVRIAADLSPGTYRYNLVVRDTRAPEDDGPRAGNYHRGDLTVREFGVDAPILSDVAVAADSGGTWSPGGEVYLKPTPAHATGSDGVAYIFFEAYNLIPGGQYETRVQLEEEASGDSPFDVTFEGEVPADGSNRIRRMLRLDLGDTPPGRYRMTVRVRDGDTDRWSLPHRTDIVVNRSS